MAGSGAYEHPEVTIRFTQPRHELVADERRVVIDGTGFNLAEVASVSYGARSMGGEDLGEYAVLYYLRLTDGAISKEFSIAQEGRFALPTLDECDERWRGLLDLVDVTVCRRLAQEALANIRSGREVRYDGVVVSTAGLTGTSRFGSKELAWADVGDTVVEGNELHVFSVSGGRKPVLKLSLEAGNVVVLPWLVRLVATEPPDATSGPAGTAADRTEPPADTVPRRSSLRERANRGVASVRSATETARQSAVTAKVTNTARSAHQAVTHAATDAERRETVVTAVGTTVDAALDAAMLRDRSGKVSSWRVARAAIRPRKTARDVAAAVPSVLLAQMTTSRSDATRSAGCSDDDVLRDWDLDDRDTATARWAEGTTRYGRLDAEGRGDNESYRGCARLMCEGLKHCLVGAPLLDDDQAVDTAGDVLAATLHPTDSAAWAPEDEAMLRLALAVSRRYGVQPVELGGNGELDALFQVPAHRMRMAMAIAPGPWSSNLAAWFTDAGQGPPPATATQTVPTN